MEPSRPRIVILGDMHVSENRSRLAGKSHLVAMLCARGTEIVEPKTGMVTPHIVCDEAAFLETPRDLGVEIVSAPIPEESREDVVTGFMDFMLTETRKTIEKAQLLGIIEPQRDDSQVCSRHGRDLDSRGKCAQCYLLSGRNRRFTKGKR